MCHKAAIYKMFGSHHVHQALKNNRSVGWHNFFYFFFIFSIFLYQAREIYLKRMLTKGYLVPWNFSWIQNYKLICEKKGGPKFPTALNFCWPKFLSPLQNFVTQGQQVF